MEALGISLGYLIVQILNFLIVLVVLNAWVFKPIMGVFQKRREKISQGLEDARVAAEARANAEKEAREIIAKAETERQQKVRDASQQAEQTAKDVLAQADVQAAKIKDNAQAEIAQERNQILADVRGQVAALAMSATQKLLGEALDEKRQRALIDEFFSGVKAGKVTILESGMAGDAVEVTSALPLTESERQAVETDVLSKIGTQAAVTFRIDPGILGGLVVKVGDKILDGSVAGKLDTMRQSLH
ncbi:MAG TPA: F0F1 ATP synthase subunit B [Anaerolineales bacterium]|nr:F0F1 ATP synthase subunit B [Anaerolineales bacterium]